MAIKPQYNQNKKLDCHTLLLKLRWSLLPFEVKILEFETFYNKNNQIKTRSLKQKSFLLNSVQTVIKINYEVSLPRPVLEV